MHLKGDRNRDFSNSHLHYFKKQLFSDLNFPQEIPELHVVLDGEVCVEARGGDAALLLQAGTVGDPSAAGAPLHLGGGRSSCSSCGERERREARLWFWGSPTFSRPGEEPAGLQRENFDEADARLLRDADFQSQVLHQLAGPQAQAELVAAQPAREQLLVGQQEGEPSPGRNAHGHAELLSLPLSGGGEGEVRGRPQSCTSASLDLTW